VNQEQHFNLLISDTIQPDENEFIRNGINLPDTYLNVQYFDIEYHNQHTDDSGHEVVPDPVLQQKRKIPKNGSQE